MSKKFNILNLLVTLVLTMLALLYALNVSKVLYNGEIADIIIKFLVGAVFAGLINAIFHELGHLIAGKVNKFAFSSMVIWFFKWTKVNKKIRFSFVMMGEEAGYTEMIPTTTEGVEKGFASLTRGGMIGSLIVTLLGFPPLFMTSLPEWVYSLWVMLFPIGIYYLFGALMPYSSYGILNDGAVLYHLKKQTDNSKVMINLLKIQAELYSGKTPSEIDESLYFDLPQLPEDNPNFALLLNARYAYYLDREDYENAKKVTQRILSLEDYLPKHYTLQFKADALFNACTFDLDESVADDLMYELEKYLNNINTATNVRIKLAYLMNINGEKDGLDIFIKKARKEAKRSQIKGLGDYENKLLDRLVVGFDKNNSK